VTLFPWVIYGNCRGANGDWYAVVEFTSQLGWRGAVRPSVNVNATAFLQR
jgi:hypothetical protein